MNRVPKSRYRLSHEGKLTWLTLAAAAPAAAVALALLWFGDYSAKVQWTLTILIAASFFGFISSAREHIVHPLQTMSNLLAALREGDYSIRARGASADNALGEVLLEINSLGETLPLKRRRFCARSWGKSTLRFSLSIHNGVCVLLIAPAKLCSANQWTNCWAKAHKNLASTPVTTLTRTNRLHSPFPEAPVVGEFDGARFGSRACRMSCSC